LIILAAALLAYGQLYYWIWTETEPVVWEVKSYSYPYLLEKAWTGSGEPFQMWANLYAFVVSALTPKGGLVEGYYKRAVALIQIPEIDPERDLHWYIPYPYVGYSDPLGVFYQVTVPIKVGKAPILNKSNLVPFYGVELVEMQFKPMIRELQQPKKVWAVWDVMQKTGSYLMWINLVIYIQRNGSSLCVFGGDGNPFYAPEARFRVPWTCVDYRVEPGLHNVTAVALKRSVELYFDGKLVFAVLLKGGNLTERPLIDRTPKLQVDDEPWIWVGPTWNTLSLRIYASFNLVSVPLRSLGNVTLLVGNGTVALPRYIYVVSARDGDFDGFWLRTSPPPFVSNAERQYRFKEWYFEVSDRYVVYFNETPVELPRGAVVGAGCNLTDGALVPLKPRGLNATYFAVLGSGRVYCPWYRVAVELPNGTSVELKARPGEVVRVDLPPVVELLNETRFVNPSPVVVKVNYSDVRLSAPYAHREYPVRVYTPLGVEEVWVKRGEVFRYPGGEYDLGNGTKVNASPISVNVTGPTWLKPSYVRYYRVEVATPLGTSAQWLVEGYYFRYDPPPIVDLGNGTALRSPNGTCAFHVDGPKRCVIAYRERLYWVSVNAPFNKTEGWALEGSVVRLPEVFDMGNGTRWVGPGFYAVVNRPINVTMTYKRQYYVEVAGVVELRGWADGDSQIRLNETVVGGIKYVPEVPFIEVRGPVSIRPNYTAYYYAQFSDALGLPNPWASVELCGRRFAADEAGRAYAVVETDSLCEVRTEAPSLGPYSLAIIGAVAAVAVAVAARRLKKRK